ncbi:unnamed protein product [Linum trigynum]|uniref:Uncharacterized protein n=1 Tax=Linum trigynum TaxID=586398 RepID=A0AAV2EVM3_9ROSI
MLEEEKETRKKAATMFPRWLKVASMVQREENINDVSLARKLEVSKHPSKSSYDALLEAIVIVMPSRSCTHSSSSTGRGNHWRKSVALMNKQTLAQGELHWTSLLKYDG